MAVDPKDTQFINQLLNGDKNALYLLYDKYSSALYGVILRMCGDQDMAQDLLQESFIKIWKNIGSYDSQKGKFYTWAYRIAKNTTLNYLRKSSPLIQTDDLSVYENKNPEAENKDYSDLNGLLAELEPQHQLAINLVYFKGFTHQEAHKEMNVPLGSFKSYIRQALLILRERRSELLMLVFVINVCGHG
jgi:RNA polymerase sigma-70 factor (ECF subfamily)